ncbi:stress-responsive transcription factor hsf1 [Irineochytrium annulatum]|nr:stress-responsive transcription factor hsf1 [Irineochytrium annulatum]
MKRKRSAANAKAAPATAGSSVPSTPSISTAEPASVLAVPSPAAPLPDPFVPPIVLHQPPAHAKESLLKKQLIVGTKGPAPSPLSATPTPLPSSTAANPRLAPVAKPYSVKNVPAFLNKLYNMVSDEDTNDLIHWSDDGTAFIVQRHEDFARDVLPKFFKHNNFSSFVRQLNMYGFHKIPHIGQGALHSDGLPEMWEFANPHFQRNQPDLLCLVSRKKGREGEGEKDNSGGVIDVNGFLHEISAIKRHQLAISTDLKAIQRENQVLWSESMALRERYQRQQDTIDKIVRFLASVFSSKKAAKPAIHTKKRRLLLEDGTAPEVSTSKEISNADLVHQRVLELIQTPELKGSPVDANPSNGISRTADDLASLSAVETQPPIFGLAEATSALVGEGFPSQPTSGTPIPLQYNNRLDEASQAALHLEGRIDALDNHLQNVLDDPFVELFNESNGDDDSFLSSFIDGAQGVDGNAPSDLDGILGLTGGAGSLITGGAPGNEDFMQNHLDPEKATFDFFNLHA